jgi:hypothetical protein
VTYPRETSTATDYMEVVFTGTDFGIRVDQTATAAPVVDIHVDGVLANADQSLFLIPGASSLYQFLATDLAPGQHTIRLTLKSGTLRWYQLAWLAGPATANLFGTPGGLRRMVPGRYYSNQHDPIVAATIAYLNAGDMYVAPIWVPTATAFTKLGANVTTLAAGATITLGVYDADAYDQPRTLLFSSAALSAATTGWKEGSIVQTLQPGLYWVALLALGGGPRVNGTSQPHPAVASANGSFANPLCGYVATGSAALPGTWTATAAAASVPLVALKAA